MSTTNGRMLWAALLAAGALVAGTALPGCASYTARDSQPPGVKMEPYQGTSDDLEMIGNPSLWSAATPLHVLDLPLSFVADTLLLPADVTKRPSDRGYGNPEDVDPSVYEALDE